MSISMEATEKLLEKMIVSVWGFKRPQNTTEHDILVGVWYQSLNAIGDYPEPVYDMAFGRWFGLARATDSPPRPGDILTHCGHVMADLGRDPKMRERVRLWREERRKKIDSLLAEEDNDNKIGNDDES
jgi:hypothetical protein|nr:MAG TPA: Loader and inhibitor of phage G40P [Caudoviricetes sp.]DAN71033.1 MAG TPA: Loader and inhibitor of phage G40P [Bacteriophage sp.]